MKIPGHLTAGTFVSGGFAPFICLESDLANVK